MKKIIGFFRALWLVFTGMFASTTRQINQNAEVIRGRYDDAIGEQTKSLETFTEAVSDKGATIKKRQKELVKLQDELAEKKRYQQGAINMIKSLAKGFPNEEALKSSEQYIKCNDAFNTLRAEIAEKEKRIKDMQAAIEVSNKDMARQKAAVLKMRTEIANLKDEKLDTVSRVELAKNEAKANALLSNIDTHTKMDEIQEIRSMADSLEARAETSAELAGETKSNMEEEFKKYADANTDNEFDKLLNLGSLYDKPETKKEQEAVKLPE